MAAVLGTATVVADAVDTRSVALASVWKYPTVYTEAIAAVLSATSPALSRALLPFCHHVALARAAWPAVRSLRRMCSSASDLPQYCATLSPDPERFLKKKRRHDEGPSARPRPVATKEGPTARAWSDPLGFWPGRPHFTVSVPVISTGWISQRNLYVPAFAGTFHCSSPFSPGRMSSGSDFTASAAS